MSILFVVTMILSSLVLAEGLPIVDMVLVKKSERKLYLIKEGKVFREYGISLGDSPAGHKQQEGDEKTPEGKYMLDWRNSDSKYHKSIHISYPNKDDINNAKKKGVNTGGAIMIHGRPNWNWFGWASWFLDGRDWTDGCIAVTDKEMDEIWVLVKVGTSIEIQP